MIDVQSNSLRSMKSFDLEIKTRKLGDFEAVQGSNMAIFCFFCSCAIQTVIHVIVVIESLLNIAVIETKHNF